MTENKILRKLEDYANKLGYDFVILRICDDYAHKKPEDPESSEPLVMLDDYVRETRTLGDIVKQFLNKEGKLYDNYKISANFKALEKEIVKPGYKAPKVYKVYKDSFDEYYANWQKRHPGEDFDEWVKKMEKKRHEKFVAYLNMIGAYNDPKNPFFHFYK